MKLHELHLHAYGPFTDQRLDLSAGHEGLHLIFGHNEAGKSSALRALKALLYGVPERTQDTFIHPNAALRIGARLRGRDGQELHCYRRKGRKDTLLDSDARPIPEARLTQLLNGIDERLFERLFGIDHQTLVSGGEALLAERGREAEALFGSALGSTQIHTLLNGLDSEAAALFAPRAHKPAFNASLGHLAELQRQLREQTLSARQWDDARKALGEIKQALADIDRELSEATARRQTLERLRRTLPSLARRAQLRERLAELAGVVLLHEDFCTHRDEADAKRRLAREQLRIARARAVALSEKASAETLSQDLLAQAEVIDLLREQLGSYRKAARDRPALLATAEEQSRLAAQRLATIRPGLALSEVEPLRTVLGRHRRAAELGGHREALDMAVRTARTRLTQTELALTDATKTVATLANSPPLEGLERAVKAARRVGDLDGAIGEAEDQLQRHTDTCARELDALALWSETLATLRHAPLPGTETIRRFAADFQTLDDEHRQHVATRDQIDHERQRTAESLRILQLTGATPCEADLLQARAHREAGWQLIRRTWQTGLDVTAEAKTYSAEADLPDAFEQAVETADALADRLRREAQRVHEQAAAQAMLEAQTQSLATLEATLEALAEKQRTLEASWQTQWHACAIRPLPPREMTDWLAQATRLREKAEMGDTLQKQLDVLRLTRTTHAQALVRQLTALSQDAPQITEHAPLAALLDHAEARLHSLQQTHTERQTLIQRIGELDEARRALELEVETAQTAHQVWQNDWAALTHELGLPAQASPGDVSDYLEAIDAIFKLLDEARGLQRRISGIDADARDFEQAVADLSARLAPDLQAVSSSEAVLHLHRRLIEQREAQSRFIELREQAEQAQLEIRQAEAELQAAEETLAELCRQAGCQHPDALSVALEQSDERRRLTDELHKLESALLDSGDGLTIAALETEAATVERERIVEELSALNTRIESGLRPRHRTLLEQQINAERDFTAMAGDDAASTLAEETEQTLASLRAHAEQYVRTRLAARVLRDTIEQFRRQHRDPILMRTSSYFAKLTCGGFAAVESDFDETDQSVLVGVRENGEHVRVEAMSTGTRDQLYLALRLATLEHYLDSAHPLPFVVDDILIQFDDMRARATLDALADFSAKTQVILFTHHASVVEQARTLEDADTRVFVHALS